jgi:hypothetical protein
MDFAPTFARMLGVEMETDGHVIEEMIPGTTRTYPTLPGGTDS